MLSFNRTRMVLIVTTCSGLACEKPAPVTPGESAPASAPAAEAVAPHACRVFVNDEQGTFDVRVNEAGEISYEAGGELVMVLGDGRITTLQPRSFGSHWHYSMLSDRTYRLPDPEAAPGEEGHEGGWEDDEPHWLVDLFDEDVLDPAGILDECIDKLEMRAAEARGEEVEHDAAGEAYDLRLCSEERYYDHYVSVGATLGPWLSYAELGSKKFEPYHEESLAAFSTYNVRGDAGVEADGLIGELELQHLRENYAESLFEMAYDDLIEGGYDEPGEESDPDEEARENAKYYAEDWSPGDIGFRFSSTVLWVMTHVIFDSDYNGELGFELHADVETPHPSLAPYLPQDISHIVGDQEHHTGWVDEGCLSIEVADGTLRSHSGQRVTLPVHNHLTGVYWVPLDFPFSVDLLAPPDPPPLEGSFALSDARAAVKAKDYTRAIAIFDALRREDPKARHEGELCWTYFLAGELEAAEAACRDALIDADTPAKLGAIAYNLGRIAEGREEPEVALDFYETSLRLRPNKTVQARADALRGSIKKSPTK